MANRQQLNKIITTISERYNIGIDKLEAIVDQTMVQKLLVNLQVQLQNKNGKRVERQIQNYFLFHLVTKKVTH